MLVPPVWVLGLSFSGRRVHKVPQLNIPGLGHSVFPTTHHLIQLTRQGEGIRREEKGKRTHTLGIPAFRGKKEE